MTRPARRDTHQRPSRIERLLAAVSDPDRGYRLGDRSQRPETIQRRLIFARLWFPQDSVETFVQRNPGWSASTAKRLIFELRRAAQMPQGIEIPPAEVAGAYLARFGSPRVDG